MKDHEVNMIHKRIDKLAIGIGRHLETLLGQIDERFNQIESNNTKPFISIDTLPESKVYHHCD
ncbi:hypothetical protein [Litchfieldia salsa]|uniref:Uncharacterized protein n=1 Tax=Litchfieldia salsa TaxID=930152 RepID=A0A1H0U149_9BACI|nr:hypothetical protein [Litchfieldia salsa]SDP60012.1 hypothetical protein SAMN05216565_10485 [Litchfieldia salsa]